MLRDVIDVLRCPHCSGPLALGGGTVRCQIGHTFDLARQGYVNLRRGHARAHTADSAAMVAAREAFVRAGHLVPINDVLAAESARVLEDGPGGCVVEVGAGTGHGLAAVLERLPGRAGVALDASPPALRRAARAHPRIGAVACDAWEALPLADGSAALVLSVFAPRNGAESARILRPGGAAIVVTPTARHLSELVGRLGLVGVETGKLERLDAQLGTGFALERRVEHDARLWLGHEDVVAAVSMGPSARHLDAATLARRVSGLSEPLGVTASVTLSTYRRR